VSGAQAIRTRVRISWKLFPWTLVAVLGVGLGIARADGTPDITVAVSSASVLLGDPAHVTVTAANPPGTYGYNLTYRVVLPAGVTYAGGAPTAPQQIANAPSGGETTLIFSNVSDLSPNSSRAIGFDLTYSQTAYDVGSTFPVAAQAFVNSDPRFVPKFDAGGVNASDATGSTAELSGTQTINAIKVSKNEPSAEGEILRGLHDHQTVYTLNVQNNSVNSTAGTTLDDYLPAGLEFLGCGNGSDDHTTNAPTNPGSSAEYPGSGPIVIPSLAGCVDPIAVDTFSGDPDGAGPLASGVYTHVTWNVGTLLPGARAARSRRRRGSGKLDVGRAAPHCRLTACGVARLRRSLRRREQRRPQAPACEARAWPQLEWTVARSATAPPRGADRKRDDRTAAARVARQLGRRRPCGSRRTLTR
jgi:hypothetical protein